MFNLFNFHFHLTVQEIKVLLAVGSNDAKASVDEVVRAVLGVVISLTFLMAVLSFLSGVMLVIVTLGGDSESIRLLYNKLLLGGIGIPIAAALRRILFSRPP